MTENTEDNNIDDGIKYIDGGIYDVPVRSVNVNPGRRAKSNKFNYKSHPKYIALKLSMQLDGQFHAITVNPNLDLIAGFWRYSIAFDLGWKTIRVLIKDVSEAEAFLIELVENTSSTPFTDYDFYVAIAKLKVLYEKKYPYTGQGKHDRSSFKNKDRSDSFAAYYSVVFGLNMRSIQYKVLIGEGLKDGKFSQSTVSLLKEGNVPQKKLISILRKQKRLMQQNLNKKEVKLEEKVIQKEFVSQRDEKSTDISPKTKSQNFKVETQLKQVKQVKDSTESTYNEVNMRLKDKINKKKESKDSPIEKSETLRVVPQNIKDQEELKKDVNDPSDEIIKTFIHICPHCNTDLLVYFNHDRSQLLNMEPLDIKSSVNN